MSSIISAYSISYFREKFENEIIALVAVLIIILILTRLLIFAFEQLIERSEKLRKLIFGSNFVEGYWSDLSFDRSTNKFIHVVLIRIGWNEKGLTVNGLTYDYNGRRIATWRAIKPIYKEHVLCYQYESMTEYADSPVEYGVAQLQFDSPATSYTGFFFDYSGNLTCRVIGKRVDNNLLSEHNYLQSSEDKQECVMKIISREVKNECVD